MSLHSLNGKWLPSDDEREVPVVVVPICTSPLLRLGLETILADGGFAVHGDIIDDRTNLPRIPSGTPALFVIDGNSFAEGTVGLVAKAKAHAPTAKVVVLADHFDLASVLAAWKAGADGFCLSTLSHDILVASLELVMLGEVVLPSTMLPPAADACLLQGEAPCSDRGKLSNREAEILACLKEGSSNKVIARRFNLSEATVKVHIKAIMRKLGAHNRTQAALWAQKHTAAGFEAS